MAQEKEKKQAYRIKGTAFKFKGVVYPEGSLVKMTDIEINREKGKLTLIPEESSEEGTGKGA